MVRSKAESWDLVGTDSTACGWGIASEGAIIWLTAWNSEPLVVRCWVPAGWCPAAVWIEGTDPDLVIFHVGVENPRPVDFALSGGAGRIDSGVTAGIHVVEVGEIKLGAGSDLLAVA